MRTRTYPSFLHIDDAELPEAARERLLAIRRYDALRAAGCAEQAALEEIGVSRRTMFRWKAALAARGQRGLVPQSTRRHRVRRRAYTPLLEVRSLWQDPFMTLLLASPPDGPPHPACGEP